MDGIRTERRGGTVEITIDRPKANAIDSATSRALGESFAGFRDEPELRVAILTAAGERFFPGGTWSPPRRATPRNGVSEGSPA